MVGRGNLREVPTGTAAAIRLPQPLRGFAMTGLGVLSPNFSGIFLHVFKTDRVAAKPSRFALLAPR